MVIRSMIQINVMSLVLGITLNPDLLGVAYDHLLKQLTQHIIQENDSKRKCRMSLVQQISEFAESASSDAEGGI